MLNKITENVEIHQTLPDTPNLTPEELKKKWDEGNKIIKEHFNQLIDSLNDAEVEGIKNRIEWKSQDVNLSYNQNTTIEDIKNASEVIVIFRVSDTSYVQIYYPREMSKMWLNAYCKPTPSTDGRASAYIDFTNGYIQNSTAEYVDLAISKVLWR